MSCDDVRELFSDHLDGALSVEAEDLLGRHIEECAGCREALARYEAGVGALAECSPEPLPELRERVTRRLGSEGLLRRSSGARTHSWRPMAAALAVFAIGLAVGRSMTPRDADDARGSRVSPMAWADACAGVPTRLPSLDPRAWRALPDVEGPDRVVVAGPYAIRLPGNVTSHGPYAPDVSAAVEGADSTCLPLGAPLGTRLALSVTPDSTPQAESAGTFLVEVDPQRVLYARVLWHQQGLAWSLEGRAEATELLDVAREIAARTRVERTERAETDQTL